MKKNQNTIIEFTFVSIVLGILIAILLTAANVYLGLYAGMTISAAIPASVMSMGFFKVILRRPGLYESNIVQTIASAGSSLASGIIFTVPALLLVGAWTNFQFWPTTLIALGGGMLGVVFMIPLRKALIVEDKTLVYPEGVACAEVLKTGASEDGKNGLYTILQGLALGSVFKFLGTGMKVFQASVEKAYFAGNRVWFFGSDISPALLAIGYIVKLEVAILVLAGGLIGWSIGIPLMALSPELANGTPLDAAWTLWSTKIRYIGVGAMIVGGLWSIISVRHGIFKGLGEIKKTYNAKKGDTVERSERNMSLLPMLIIFIISTIIMFALYQYLLQNIGYTIITTLIMTILGFLFVAVSSYVVGLVGSSNNPVSGMTISVLLITSVLLLVLGIQNNSAILATLGVAAVVCCAACSAGDTSQDLKTGYLLKATPALQQWGAIIGVAASAAFIAPVLTLLHNAYGIGTGLKAPQAALFASITNAIFGSGNMPYNMIALGVILGIIVIVLDQYLAKKKSKIRLYLMPLAVGIYLPVTLAIPMFVGGLLRFAVDYHKKEEEISDSDNGVLFSSGIIAGESIMGVILAVFIYFKIDLAISLISQVTSELISVLALTSVAIYLFIISKRR